MRSRILYIAGHAEDAPHLSNMLYALPLLLKHVESLHQARLELQEHDYDVVLTEAALPDGNWLDVLHLVRENPGELEVIVTDLNMPRMDGFELIRRVRADQRLSSLPIIVVSADTDPAGSAEYTRVTTVGSS